MFKLRREQLSQVFLHSPELVKRLIGRSSIGKKDTVIEIGSGKEIITKILLQSAKAVIAIERDSTLCSFLKQQFNGCPNLNLVCADFLSFTLPTNPYKVFANIPFSIEGKIVRKLIDAPDPPKDCYLIMRKELAERLSGIPKNGLFAVMHKPWFDFEIFHRFKRSDFIPIPKVESVMLRFAKKLYPLLPESEKQQFNKFVTNIFGGGRRMRQNLKGEFNPNQIAKLARQLKINLNVKPSNLSLSQWLSIYRFSQTRKTSIPSNSIAGFSR